MTEFFAGRFELLQPIASGGMGTVWRVRDLRDGQIKAAKILGQSDATSLLRFVREQSMRIDHLHVVTPDSWAGVDDKVLFTMPMVRGGSVADLLRVHRALPVRWVAELLDQLLQALEAVHAAGIVHRDVKPANLLLEPTGSGRPHLRLTDFGIAAPVDEPRMTRASMGIGSPGYMAPEQWHGADPDPRADLYAAATVAVEMLTGSRPAATPDALDPAPLRTGSAPADSLLDLLVGPLAADPLQRPSSATELRQALAALQLTQLPPQPGESVTVPDRYDDIVPTVADSMARPPAAQFESSATRHLGAATTTFTPASPGPAQATSSAATRTAVWPSAALIVIGLAALAGAVLLWI